MVPKVKMVETLPLHLLQTFKMRWSRTEKIYFPCTEYVVCLTTMVTDVLRGLLQALQSNFRMFPSAGHSARKSSIHFVITLNAG